MLTPPNIPCDYPERLLPSESRFRDFHFSINCYLSRKSLSKELMYDDDGEIELAAIEMNRLLNYSTNLVNTKDVQSSNQAIPEDVLIEIEENQLTKPWDFKDQSVPSVDEITASNASHKGYFFIKIKDIEDFKAVFPFNLKPQKPIVEYQLVVFVRHVPNQINLSHMELECHSDVSGQMKKVTPRAIKKGGYRDLIVHIIRDRIADIYLKSLPFE